MLLGFITVKNQINFPCLIRVSKSNTNPAAILLNEFDPRLVKD